jgi:hypothetical protein
MKSIAVVSITLCLAVGIALANPPEVKTTVKLKQDAVKIFLDDKTVETKIAELEADQFFLLSIDVAPYFFTFTDEGPVGRFIVTAWLGKADERIGWQSQFVVAKVDTDKFGNLGAKLLKSDEVSTAIDSLK